MVPAQYAFGSLSHHGSCGLSSYICSRPVSKKRQFPSQHNTPLAAYPIMAPVDSPATSVVARSARNASFPPSTIRLWQPISSWLLWTLQLHLQSPGQQETPVSLPAQHVLTAYPIMAPVVSPATSVVARSAINGSFPPSTTWF
ncbi:uncharacterized protein LOC134227322 [Armigeres subalbatus]|uniref:uncharacterized protein LOC134227322 n=1 Tax=Armigeres subalbatus TaxID=124917 RepID=UPI002ED5F1D0